MGYPSSKQLVKWWDAQPDGLYTCTGCGVVRDKAYVQPQHPAWHNGQDGVALCGDCIGLRQKASAAARKSELAAMDRCEVPGCRARGTWRHNGTLVCGRHLNRAKQNVFRAASASPAGQCLGLFTTIRLNRAQLIDAATR